MAKQLSATAIYRLKEALCVIFWYKSDLESFLRNCINDQGIINRVNLGNYKRQIVSDVVNILCKDQQHHLGDIRRLMYEVCQMDNFIHLENLEDGKKKAEIATRAVQSLKELVEAHDEKIKEEELIAQRRKEAMEKFSSNKAILKKLDEIKNYYCSLFATDNHQNRGYELERIMYELFSLFDLDPKSSFKNIGEQVDGAFSLEGTDYLFEAKWTNKLPDLSELNSFKGKVERKLDNTLGLFLSINGFAKDAVNILSSSRSTILLMDGADLMTVLEGRIDFVSMLVRKRRHASQTGNIFFRITSDI
ncbi:hypothetical protein [Inediibacterium massiliense]|uniref:hypothetical protein n=1 Tax=Inediibacterium massiliense TaxID=1658111 RepID=UPI0006B5B0E6|nr:hypothetical protein [Inediibacterium massiliense]